MEIVMLFFVFGVIQSCLGSALHVTANHQTPVQFYEPHSPLKNSKEPNFSKIILTKPLNGVVNRSHHEDRSSWGREIIEISDPTTDSTLHVPNYPIDCTNEKECELSNGDTTPMPTFRPYSQEELNVFLKKYVETNGKLPNGEQPTNKLANLYMDEPINILEGAKDAAKSQEKSKSWQLMQAQAHNHPYDDRTGWVTLEPVPWSASQIQKWEPNNRPEIPQWDKISTQHQSSSGSSWNKPSNTKWQERPWNNKPTYEYPTSSKPQHWNDNNYNSRPTYHEDNWGAGSDIITDGGPTHFPHEPAKKPAWYERPHTEVVYHEEKEPYHPHSSHPAEGDGRWVLLSSTKGYSVPHRNRAYQRALLLNAKTPSGQGIPSVKSHRSIKLTVLPPLNGTNTTTSHGGLLEVEQTFQTVDEAQREHAAKMLRLETLNQTSQSPLASLHAPPPVASKRSGTAIRVYPMRVTPSQARSNAVLAAVGAGMVPATMAMLLPLVLGKRRRRSVDESFNRVNLIGPFYEQ